MARVTVEDCVLKIPNRFELVMTAAQRARDISSGASLTVDRDNDKNPVVALREIADATVSLDVLRESLIKGHQKHIESEEPEEEIIELMAGEEEWLRRTAPEDLAAGGLSETEAGDEDDLLDDEDEDEDEGAEVDEAAEEDEEAVEPGDLAEGDVDLTDDVPPDPEESV